MTIKDGESAAERVGRQNSEGGVSREHIAGVDKELNRLNLLFLECAPDFTEIRQLLEEIVEEIGRFNESLGIMLREEPQHGGGLDAGRVEGMRAALPALEAKVAIAERRVDRVACRVDCAPFSAQVAVARNIVETLKKL